MINIYDEVRSSGQFQKFEVGELLFVEYTCPIEAETAGIWTPVDSFVHVISGRKTWRSSQGSWTAAPGNTLYIKKGASFIDQHMDEDFCVLVLFVSDDFIRTVIREASSHLAECQPAGSVSPATRALELERDPTLDTWFQSMLAWFAQPVRPAEPILVVKLKELMFSILLSSHHRELASYFLSLGGTGAPDLREIMEANFCFNLSLEEYARLCHRSLSSFKRDFQATFGTSPGKWLLQRRLEHAAVLLRDPGQQVTQVAFECGFEDLSHFSRAFKQCFGASPRSWRSDLSGSAWSGLQGQEAEPHSQAGPGSDS